MTVASAPLAVVRAYLDAIEAKDEAAVASFLDPAVQQREYPNALVREGATRDRSALLAGLEAGRRVLAAERYAIEDALVDGDRVACRIHWAGTLAVPVLGREPGQTLEARFGVFFTLRAGRIVEQHNYDCFLP